MPTLFEGIGRLAKILFALLGLCVLAVLFAAGIFYYHFSRGLPKITEITDYRPPVVSEVFARRGEKIGEFWTECRFLIPFEQIPQKLIEGFIASEDARFWEHRGVDVRSILRAFIINLKAGRVVEGGSTITQQITRSLLLTRERSLERKIKEALLATQIEQNLDKKQILYLYLNQIYLGNRAYGVAAAARNYFHKNVSDLNLAEIALIAGLPSAPNSYSPINNPEQARNRQAHVLNRMLENNFISRRQMQVALKTPLKIYHHGIDKDFNLQKAPYFVEEVRRHLEEKYGGDLLTHGGLKIYTTADLAAIQEANRTLKKGLEQLDRSKPFRGPVARLKKGEIRGFAEKIHEEVIFSGNHFFLFPEDFQTAPSQEEPALQAERLYQSVVTGIDKSGNAEILIGRIKGRILAGQRGRTGSIPRVGEVYWVRKSGASFVIDQEPEIEGALFSMDPLTGEVRAIVGGYDFRKSEFNRATQALRQPGSAFKPIVYAAALDKGYTPDSVIVDAPIVYQVNPEEYWSPKNYGEKYHGPISLRGALTHSINVVAVKVLHDIGVDYMIAAARKLGITSPLNPYLSSALGASDLTLKEITRAYATLIAGGVRPEPVLIRRIEDRSGQVLEESHPPSLTPETVFATHGGEDPESINPDLMTEGERWIEKDRLNLTLVEKKILYSGLIPKGYVITPQTAYLMVHMMQDVVERGTGYRAKELGRPVAGKTGTTNEESDAWFIGSVPDLITGVWIGYDSKRPIGEKMTGGVVAAPIWLDYMQKVLKDEPVLAFKPPPQIDLAKIDTLAGGSAVVAGRRPRPQQTPVAKETPSSRGVDFLFEDLNKL